jgi:hypothetical protein
MLLRHFEVDVSCQNVAIVKLEWPKTTPQFAKRALLAFEIHGGIPHS